MSKVKEKMFKVDLQMFNDGGASGAEGTSSAATENAPKTENIPSGSSRRSKSGEFDNVVFGKQEGTASDEATSLDTGGKLTGASKTDVSTTSNTLEERQKAYDDFIKEYKDIDQKRFQDTFDRRFKEVKGMEAELASHKEVFELLSKKYGIDDVGDVKNALMEDYAFWEQEAEANGQTVEQYLVKLKQDVAINNLERENAELKAIRQRQIGEQQAKLQIAQWHRDAENVKELYPSFDLRAEIQNDQFKSLLKSGVPMRHAYEVIHMDEIVQNSARVAAQTADAQAQARIKQKASRPSENGTSSKSAVIVKDNVSSLTRKERAEIARRVARGEKISF